jgi:glutathione-regulated potassium-efflux system ancillary protein KefG
MINTEDLCDAQGVADLVGLRHPNSVHTYLRRYADMPRPVIDLGPGRPRLWLRPQIEAWLTVRGGVMPAHAARVPAQVAGAARGVPAQAGAAPVAK